MKTSAQADLCQCASWDGCSKVSLNPVWGVQWVMGTWFMGCSWILQNSVLFCLQCLKWRARKGVGTACPSWITRTPGMTKPRPASCASTAPLTIPWQKGAGVSAGKILLSDLLLISSEHCSPVLLSSKLAVFYCCNSSGWWKMGEGVWVEGSMCCVRKMHGNILHFQIFFCCR